MCLFGCVYVSSWLCGFWLRLWLAGLYHHDDCVSSNHDHANRVLLLLRHHLLGSRFTRVVSNLSRGPLVVETFMKFSKGEEAKEEEKDKGE